MQTDFRDNEAELRRRDGAKRHCRETLHSDQSSTSSFPWHRTYREKVVSNGNQNERRKQSGKGQKRKRSSPQ
jgi:hypothetical protein